MRTIGWSTEGREVERASRGDHAAFEVLVRRHVSSVRAVAMSHLRHQEDAEDATQDAFVRAYLQLHSLREPGRFVAWLIAIARNAAIDIARKRKDAVPFPSDHPLRADGQVDSALDERMEVLERHLAQLDSESREVLMLHYFARKSARKIASMLDIQPDAAKKRIQRARERLGERVMEELRREEREASERLAPLSNRIMMAIAALPLPNGRMPSPAARTTAGRHVFWRPYVVAAPVLGFIVLAVWLFQSFGSRYVDSQSTREANVRLGPSTADASVAANPTQANRPGALDPADERQRLSAENPASPVVAIDGRFDQDDPAKAPAPKHEVGPGVIRGIVVWMDGAGASSTRVSATRKTFDPYGVPGKTTDSIDIQTDAKGQFEITGLPFDTFLVRALARDATAFRTCVLRADNPEADIMMELEPTGTISGVVQTKDGTPVSGARVYPYFSERENRLWRIDWSALHATLTDATGRFVVGPLWAEGDSQLAAQAKGFATTVSELVPAGTRGLAIVLDAGDRLEGVLSVAQKGAFLEGMLVHAQSGDTARDHLTALSDSAGRFAIAGAKPGSTYQITVDAAPPLVQAATVVGTAGDTEIDVPLEVGAIISGNVLDAASREGLPSVTIRALVPGSSPESHDPTLPSATTGDDGAFMLAGLQPGTWVLTPYVPDHSRQSSFSMDGIGEHLYVPFRPVPLDKAKPVEVTVEWGMTLERTDILVDLGPLMRVTGTVVFEDGRPAPNIQVSLSGAEACTVSNDISGEDGQFAIVDTLCEGEVYLHAIGPRVASEPVGPFTVESGELSGVTLTVAECTASISGTVLLPDGAPAYAARVTAHPLDSPTGTVRSDMVGRQGRYELRNLKPGTYRIDVGPSGWNAGLHYNSQENVAEVVVAEGQTVSGTDILFSAGYSRPQEGFITKP